MHRGKLMSFTVTFISALEKADPDNINVCKMVIHQIMDRWNSTLLGHNFYDPEIKVIIKIRHTYFNTRNHISCLVGIDSYLVDHATLYRQSSKMYNTLFIFNEELFISKLFQIIIICFVLI